MGTVRRAEGRNISHVLHPQGEHKSSCHRLKIHLLESQLSSLNTIQPLETTTLSLSSCREAAGTSSSTSKKGFNAPKSHPVELRSLHGFGVEEKTTVASPSPSHSARGSSSWAVHSIHFSRLESQRKGQGKLNPWQQSPLRARAGHDCPTTEVSPELMSHQKRC